MRTLSFLACFLVGCAYLQPPKLMEEPLLHQYVSFTNHPSDVKNLNRDPDGDPWMIGGLILPTEQEFQAFPKLGFDPLLRLRQLPERVNNATKPYWRGIFAQKHGSCAQATGIAYVFTYEINRLRGNSANAAETRFPTHWTYNFVNRGYDRGSWMMWGWDVAKSMGVPNAKVYGTETGYSLQYWPSEFKVYEQALDNRVGSYFVIEADDYDGFIQIKQFLHDHGSGKEGGILSFAAGWSSGYEEAMIPAGQYEAGRKLIRSFGSVVNHAVTFVGYDDRICYDFNGDGRCTNDVDLTGDDRVDMKDWENGAFIMANSWGTRWGNEGFIYVPYRLVALSSRDGGIYRHSAYGVFPAPDEPRGKILRVEMRHSDRSDLRFQTGLHSRNGKDLFFRYYGLHNSGGSYPLNGKDDGPVTFGLDLRPLVKDIPDEDIDSIGIVLDSLGGVGHIESVSVLDYQTGKIVTSSRPVDIDTGRTTAAVNLDEDDDSDDVEPQSCRVGPVAVAGEYLTVSEHCVQVLDGSESFDVDAGEIVRYQWRQLYGKKTLKLENADTPFVTVYIPEVKRDETFWLVLTVWDKDGFADSDRIRLRVKNR